VTRYGSDVVVDLLMQAGVQHVALNPGASLRGIQDSLVHTEGAPELVLCLHEAIAVAAAQGYAKAAGRPMGVMLHDVVGLQNASMAIYNAWCDRVPMLLLGGTGPKSKRNRRPWIDWIHTASVQANIVRDFVKWDDEPHDLGSVPESFARGLGAAVSAPSGPVYLCYDVDLQEDPVPDGFAPGPPLASYAIPAPPAPAAEDIAWLADELCSARRPVLLAGFAGTEPGAFARLVELAELIGAPVVDAGVRHAFPTGHDLCATGVPGILDDADLVVALDVEDLQLLLGQATPRLVNVSVANLRLRAWAQDYQALVPAERHITATADAAVGALLTDLRSHPPEPEVVARRRRQVGARVAHAREATRAAAAIAHADGVVPVERLLFELGRALEGERFVLANGTNARLEHRLWDLDRPGMHLGWHSGGGLGYGVGATIGASVALGPDTIAVDVQADGDLLFLPNALWTAAHLRLPTLFVVHDNRQYGNTVEHAAKLARHRGRDTDRRYVGSGLTDPPVDLADLAASFGVWSAGPISDPETLAARLAEAVEVVRGGRPALLDVLTPGF
jgi:thiamine pyrophosphate-dependent acetolactate synthase large subunit-like protein